MSGQDRQFRGSLTTVVPEGWFVKESITLLAPDGQANVIASSEPLDPTLDSFRYAQIQGDLLRKEFPGYQEFSFDAHVVFGLPGFKRHFAWVPPDGLPVTQVQVYATNEGRGYTVTATTPSTNQERFWDTFMAALDEISVVHLPFAGAQHVPPMN